MKDKLIDFDSLSSKSVHAVQHFGPRISIKMSTLCQCQDKSGIS